MYTKPYNVFHQIIPGEKIEGDWSGLYIPSNIVVGSNSVIDSAGIFRQFFSKLPVGMIIGNNVTIRSASLATEENAIIEIGDFTYIYNASIACNTKISIGSYVLIAGGVNIVDSDFHPITPASRMADTIALSPSGNRKNRPGFESKPVMIEDEVWIGFNATILKGVRIGKGSVIQPGSVVVKDVPPGSVVAGNPAELILQK
jgi:acetyltransferase-like isoleucine patch superfamily enzyme